MELKASQNSFSIFGKITSLPNSPHSANFWNSQPIGFEVECNNPTKKFGKKLILAKNCGYKTMLEAPAAHASRTGFDNASN